MKVHSRSFININIGFQQQAFGTSILILPLGQKQLFWNHAMGALETTGSCYTAAVNCAEHLGPTGKQVSESNGKRQLTKGHP